MISGLPPLQWLVTFRAVIETGSFVGAAGALNVTPSAVSHQMRALEGRLGCQLFIRARRSVIPTEEALAYAGSLSESFSRIVTATNRIAGGSGLRRLAIHSSPSFATLWLTPRLGRFMAAHPEIDVILFASHEPAKLGEDGFMVDIQYARPVPESCDSIVLADETILPLATPAFIAEHRISEVNDIARVPLIHSKRCVVQWDQWAAKYAHNAMPHHRGPQFDRAHLAISACLAGLGLLLESTLQAGDILREGRLVMPFGPRGIPAVAHRLVYRREDRTHPEIAAFRDWLVDNIAAERAGELPGAATAQRVSRAPT